jgi:cation:H+ antiporter
MNIVYGIVAFVAGAVLAIWATEKLLEGLVSLSLRLRLSAFLIGAVLSGLEAENIAVGLASGGRGNASIALGTVFGGAIFLVCVALGLGAVFFPLKIQLPRRILLLFVGSALLPGVVLFAPVTPRWSGVVLLIAFALAIVYLIRVARTQDIRPTGEVAEAMEKQRPLWLAIVLTLVGLVVISVGGELVAFGAERIIALLNVPALFMGMVVTPAVIELEEIVRQAIPSKEGRHDVSAGNLVGTLLYFTLFNLGIIALLAPVRVDPLVRQLDWPFLVGVVLLAACFLWRGLVGRVAGACLLLAYVIYILLHVLLR